MPGWQNPDVTCRVTLHHSFLVFFFSSFHYRRRTRHSTSFRPLFPCPSSLSCPSVLFTFAVPTPPIRYLTHPSASFLSESSFPFGQVTVGCECRIPLTLVNESPITVDLVLDLTKYPDFAPLITAPGEACPLK